MTNMFRLGLKLFILALGFTSTVSFALMSQQNTTSALTPTTVPPMAPAPQMNVSSVLSSPPPVTVPTAPSNTPSYIPGYQNSSPPPPTNPTQVTTTETNVPVENQSSTVTTQAVPSNPGTTVVVTPPSQTAQVTQRTTTTVEPPSTTQVVPTNVAPPPTNFVQPSTATNNTTVTTTAQPTSTTLPRETQPLQAPTTGTVQTIPSPQQSVDQFEQWLRSNNYVQNQMNGGQAATTTTTTTTTSRKYGRRRARQQSVMSYQEQQDIMANSLPTSRVKPLPESDVAFNTLLQNNMPLTPKQVVRLHQQIDLAQRAQATPPNIPPKPVSSTIMVNLAPGATPPAIRLAQGYVTSLVFVDSTGAPWPIATFDVGNPKAVSIQWDSKGNVLLMQAIAPYSDGNMVIRLVGLSTPITLELVSGQRVVDFRVDIHVSGIGPNASELPTGTPLPNSASVVLLGVLDGVAPPGSKTLNVIGADAQAWLLGSEIFLRTRMTVLSPGWVGRMVSPDGMIAYELPRTSSVLISRYGEPAEIRIEGL